MNHPLFQGAQAIGSPHPYWGMDYGQRAEELLDDEGVSQYKGGSSRRSGWAQDGGPGPQGGQSTAGSPDATRKAVIRVSKGIYGTAYKLMDVSIPPVVTSSEVALRLLGSEGSHEVYIRVNGHGITYGHYRMPLLVVSMKDPAATVAALLQRIANVVYHNKHELVVPYGRAWVELAVEGIYAQPRDHQRPQAQTWIVVLYWE